MKKKKHSLTLNSLYSTNSFSCQCLRIVLSPLDFFILQPLKLGFYLDLSKESAFQKVVMISYLTNEVEVFRFYLSLPITSLESTASLLLETLSSLEPPLLILFWPLYSFYLLHWSLFFQNSIFDSCYTLTLNDFIYFLKNYKQIFISNPGLSLTL